MHSKSSLLVLLSSLFFVLVSSYRFDPLNYTNSTDLSSRYTLHWRVDLKQQVVYLAFEVHTNGWIGFGLAEQESGSMPGADMITGFVKDGQGVIQDRWSSEYALPSIDSCQNWQLVNSHEDEKSGLTVIEVSRDLITNDTQDRPVLAGPTRIVWAFGDDDYISYHGSDRGFTAVVFYGTINEEVVIDDENSMTKDFLMSGAQIPPKQTTYMCQAFQLPFLEYGPAHVVKVDPIVYTPTMRHVHHFFIHSCRNTSGGFVEKYINNPHQCYTPTGDPDSGCISELYAWAMGGNSLVLPPQAGFLMNNSEDGLQYIVVEVHYDNPDLLPGLVDYSGIKLHWTQQLRQYDAGVLILGDYTLHLPDVPPRTKAFEAETSCPSECTSQWKNDINVFQDFLHMHQIGDMMWSTVWDTNNNSLGEINRIEYFSFDHQHTMPTNRTIHRGERINTHCVWNSMERSDPTRMGLQTEDEMCIEFLYYYPVLTDQMNRPYLACIYRTPNVTGCGNYRDPKFEKTIPQPYRPDPEGGVTKLFGIQNCVAPETNENNDKHAIAHENWVTRVAVTTTTLLIFCVVAAIVIYKKRGWIAKKILPKK
eukprot:TRINITY_DN4047_c0_g1_i1.p1 TRINITY_DN4047_c0_g1~~TRINITY_DN4047_c0_g1_i1.p1  ORF type:complete len:590 (-),score=110.31 TRINITY_DN4047_c0_g1_i1:96-1865(-)